MCSQSESYKIRSAKPELNSSSLKNVTHLFGLPLTSSARGAGLTSSARGTPVCCCSARYAFQRSAEPGDSGTGVEAGMSGGVGVGTELALSLGARSASILRQRVVTAPASTTAQMSSTKYNGALEACAIGLERPRIFGRLGATSSVRASGDNSVSNDWLLHAGRRLGIISTPSHENLMRRL